MFELFCALLKGPFAPYDFVFGVICFRLLIKTLWIRLLRKYKNNPKYKNTLIYRFFIKGKQLAANTPWEYFSWSLHWEMWRINRRTMKWSMPHNKNNFFSDFINNTLWR